jgi:hypothetical protein
MLSRPAGWVKLGATHPIVRVGGRACCRGPAPLRAPMGIVLLGDAKLPGRPLLGSLRPYVKPRLSNL